MESAMSESTTLLRHEPVQARSNARLSALLDAAAITIDTVGYERLTTAMVAERAGASIGTVYRYFPDRIAVLQGVAARACDHFLDHFDTAVATKAHSSWAAVVDSVFDDLVAAFTHQPAFAALRFGDVLDLRPRERKHTGISVVSARVANLLAAEHGLTAGNELKFHLEVAFTLADRAYIDEARSQVHRYLVGVYGESTQR